MMRDGASRSARSASAGPERCVPSPETEIALLRTFADQAVIAIENVRLFEQNRALTEPTPR